MRYPRKTPAGTGPSEVSRLMASPPPSPSAVGLELAGAPLLLLGKGFYGVGSLQFGTVHLLRIPAMGFWKEGASPRPQEPTTALFKSGNRLLGTAPWTQPPSRSGQRPEGPPALGSGPGPRGAHLSFPAPGWSLPVLGGVQNPGCGNQVKSFLKAKRLALVARSPGPPNSGRSSALFPPPLPSPRACRLIIRF